MFNFGRSRSVFPLSRVLLPLLFLFWGLTSHAFGHALDEATWKAQVDEDGNVESVLRVPAGLISPFDLNQDGRIDAEEMRPEIGLILEKFVRVEGDGKPGTLTLLPVEFGAPQATHTVVQANWSFPERPRDYSFAYGFFPPGEESPKCMGTLKLADGFAIAHVFTEAEPVYKLSESSRGFSGFFLVGVEHIIFGFDHLLFVAVLMLAGGSPMQLLKMVTAFTVAHSLTLALAVLGIFTLPSSIVEPVIALSIAVAALENVRRDEPDDRWKLAAGFGLIHGMGFAGVLADMNLSGSSAAVPLLGFNLGVEAGQIGMILFALPAYYYLSTQDWNRKFRVAASILAALIALYWTVERVFL